MSLLGFSGAEDTVREVYLVGTVALSSAQKRSGSNSYLVHSTINPWTNYIVLPFSSPASTAFIQGCLYPIMQPVEDATFFSWMSGVTRMGSLVWKDRDVDPTIFEVWTGDKSTKVGTFQSNLPVGLWSTVEVKVVVHDTTGEITVRFNGAQVFTFTGDTKPSTETTIDRACFATVQGTSSPGDDVYWDDLIACDDQGSYMNSWLRGARITALRPDGAGNYSQWVPSSGNNWDCVNETPVSDTDYVSCSSAGQKDTYTMTDCPAEVKTNIKAVVPRYWGDTNGQIKRLVRIGGSDYLSGAIDYPGVFNFAQDIMYVSPATTNPWTIAEINGMESGMEKQ